MSQWAAKPGVDNVGSLALQNAANLPYRARVELRSADVAQAPDIPHLGRSILPKADYLDTGLLGQRFGDDSLGIYE
jgi:hypothetical protein